MKLRERQRRKARSCLFDGDGASEADTALFPLALLSEYVEFSSGPNGLERVVLWGLHFHGYDVGA